MRLLRKNLRKNWTTGIVALALSAGLSILPSLAQAENIWDDSFMLQSSGIVNPLVAVGFNPCPEPPIHEPDFDDPTAPSITIPTLGAGEAHTIVFAIAAGGEPLTFRNFPNAPDALGMFSFRVDGSSETLVNVTFGITDSAGARIANWNSFIPEPLPGGDPFAQVGFEFDFVEMPGFGGSPPSDATLTLEMTDRQGGSLSFAFALEVPSLSPIGMALFAGGLGLGGWRRLRIH